MQLLISAEESTEALQEELLRGWPAGRHAIVGPRLVTTDAAWSEEAPPCLVFARQALPDAVLAAAPSISGWAEVLLTAMVPALPEDQPWRLHVEPLYGEGEPTAGRNRCRLIVESLREKLSRKRRRLLRALEPEPAPGPFGPAHSLVQLILTGPERGYVSVCAAPGPDRLRRVVAPFPAGEVPVAVDKAAPSRAFAKLVEAELRLGLRIAPGDTCVDLGASPGSWTYVALNRGARVTAVDRSPLREDLMRHPGLEFRQADAFKFAPETPVDWLLCDVIAAPERSIELVLDWARRGWARRLVVTIKFKGREEYAVLDRLKDAMPSVSDQWGLTRLCANKNEACVFGVVRESVPAAE